MPPTETPITPAQNDDKRVRDMAGHPPKDDIRHRPRTAKDDNAPLLDDHEALDGPPAIGIEADEGLPERYGWVP